MCTMFSSIEISILKVMHSRRIYGANHKKIETILHSGFPSHEYKKVKKGILMLLRKGYIVWYNRSKGAIQLNKSRYDEIQQIIINSH